MINLNWVKYQNGNWCDLLTLNLGDRHFYNLEGVYILWHSGLRPAVVRLGQGIIKDRLEEHRNNPEILKYKKQGSLYVTWAYVSKMYRDGIEKYLAEKWNPKIGSNFPDTMAIIVNSPWN